jgi:hypothetical protein
LLDGVVVVRLCVTIVQPLFVVGKVGVVVLVDVVGFFGSVGMEVGFVVGLSVVVVGVVVV